MIYCAYHELDPLEVVITECPVSLSPESVISGAWIANADLVTPKQVKRYRWETYISKIAEFTAIHEACVASGLLCVRSTKSYFVVAVCDWTETVDADEVTWVSSGWYVEDYDDSRYRALVDCVSYEVLQVLESDKHGHPTQAILRRK